MSFKMDKASTLLIRIEDYTCTLCFILFPCSCTWFISTQNKYGTITNAIDKKDGIAVVAVLFEVFSNSFRLSRNQSHFEKKP